MALGGDAVAMQIRFVSFQLNPKGIELVIIRTDIDEAVGDRWRGDDVPVCGIGPEGLAGTATGGIEGIEPVIPRADIDEAVGDRW